MAIQEEYEQRYVATLKDPVAVWLFCRLCRCRIQVRTVPRTNLPFRCFCGYSGTFATFDVFTEENEAQKFARTFEDLYQTTKSLLKEASMPTPKTQIYRAGHLSKLLMEPQAKKPAPAEMEESDDDEDPDETDTERFEAPQESEVEFRQKVRALSEKVQKSADVIARHKALSKLGAYLFARRTRYPDARQLCYQACTADVQAARDIAREAAARFKRGEKVRLHFPTFRQLQTLYEEDKSPERALEVASRGAALGLPRYHEQVARLRSQLGW